MMKREIKIFLVLLMVAVALIGAAGCSGNGGPEIAAVNHTAPGFRLKTTDGREVPLSDLKGKPVLLNFWATWCGPCRFEMPLLQEIHGDPGWSERGLTIIAVNLTEPVATVQGYMEDNGYSFTALLDESGEVGTLYNVRYIPTTYFIDKDGIISDIKVGAFQNKAEIDQILSNMVGE